MISIFASADYASDYKCWPPINNSPDDEEKLAEHTFAQGLQTSAVLLF
jgi:hypothetical protein